MKLFSLACSCVCFMMMTLSSATASEEGMASYYADSLNGKPTASGEAYDRTELTAAHRTLSFGTRVQVTNLNNGQSVVVRVNDRGPHVEGRVIDVSGAAAEKLGLIDSGTAKVKIDLLD